MSSTRSDSKSWEQSRRADSSTSARISLTISQRKDGINCLFRMVVRRVRYENVPELTEEVFHLRAPLTSMFNIFDVYSIWSR